MNRLLSISSLAGQFQSYQTQASQSLTRLRRSATVAGCFLTALYLVYRGNTFYEPHFSLIVPVMCVLTAFVVGALGLSMALRTSTDD